MMTLPADVARCRGRAWPEDTFLAPVCQECKRWVAHYCQDENDGPVAHIEPPTARDCPLRMPVDEGKTHNVGVEPVTPATEE